MIYACTLRPHDPSALRAADAVSVRLCVHSADRLELTYVLEGDVSRIRVPEPAAARIADRLWEHTCFELFVRESGSPAYYELNFAPSGEWAVHAFEDYRKGGPLESYAPAPRISVRRDSHALELDAYIELKDFARLTDAVTLSIALAAVVEDVEGVLSYWALAHPAGKPDFHHRTAFALNVPLGAP